MYPPVMSFPTRLASVRLLFRAAAAATLAACSSASFGIATGSPDAAKDHAAPPGNDAGATDTGTADAGVGTDATMAHDGGHDSGGKHDTGAADTGKHPEAGCSTPSPTSVYVLAAAPLGGNGSQRCPFKTIAQGLAAVAPTAATGNACTVNVGAGTYDDPDISVIAHVTLLGGSTPATYPTIKATGALDCNMTSCAVSVRRGGTLNGFNVQLANTVGDGIVGQVDVADSLGPPSVLNVVVTGGTTTGTGITALGGMNVGPAVTVNGNMGDGLVALGAGTIHVIQGTSPAQDNTFSNNAGNGLNIEGTGRLDLEQATASNNADSGIRIATTAPDGGTMPSHTVTSLTASGNKNTGISAYTSGAGGQPLTLRSSVLLGNVNAGLYYDYGASAVMLSSPLDIGSSGSNLGNNVFGTAVGASSAKGVGIFLCHSGLGGTQPAEGDTFSACPPTSKQVASCGATPNGYVDVAYAPTASGTDPIPNPVPDCNTTAP